MYVVGRGAEIFADIKITSVVIGVVGEEDEDTIDWKTMITEVQIRIFTFKSDENSRLQLFENKGHAKVMFLDQDTDGEVKIDDVILERVAGEELPDIVGNQVRRQTHWIDRVKVEVENDKRGANDM